MLFVSLCMFACVQKQIWWSMRWCGGIMGFTSVLWMLRETHLEILTRKSSSLFTVSNKNSCLIKHWLSFTADIQSACHVLDYLPIFSQTGLQCCSSSLESSCSSSSSASVAASVALRNVAAMSAVPAAPNSAAVQKKVRKSYLLACH